jgi:uncharacterized NAD(P)/FAD-binding protein YdhS
LATITVRRTDGGAGGVSVRYATAPGTATAGADFARVKRQQQLLLAVRDKVLDEKLLPQLAPQIGAHIDRMLAEGRLAVVSGRVKAITADADGVRLDWRPRQGPAREPLTARWLLDCTGPGHAPEADPVTGPLLTDGRARLDPLRLGLELDASGRVLAADGDANPRLFVLGPPARAAFWETIAVPDIRKRIEDVVLALV